MTRKENELMEVPYSASFKEMFTIKNDLNLLLNSMSVCGCMDTLVGKMLDKPVNFDIRVINGKKVIYPLEHADSFFLQAKRLVRATVLEIKADDCYMSTGSNGDFTFVLKNDEKEKE